MKIKNINEFDTWELKHVSKAYGMSERNLRYRCRKLGIYPKNVDGKFMYKLNSLDIDRVLEMVKRKEDTLPEVIYVHTTWHILESKLNYL